MSRNIGNMIKDGRKRAGMTQGELGERIGVSAPTICELEAGDRKSNPNPEDVIKISDALMDTAMLHQYCISCPLRSRISIRKFKPLNHIVPGVLPSVLKNIQKIGEAMEMLNRMLPKMLTRGFEADPDFIEFRNDAVLRAIDVRRGLEIFFDQMAEANLLTDADLKMLEDVQQRLCEQKGHHIPDGITVMGL